jgi:2-polyprenyl-6-hydroxyphenyl methylase/3-demethylubiquinone-9 3-methyltransferase
VENYYSTKLAAHRLRRVYEIASPRVQQYLRAEIDFVLQRVKPHDRVLELGCGYGRVLQELTVKTKPVFGIDTSPESLRLAKSLPAASSFRLASMNAGATAFKPDRFDVTVCIQNGISAFQVEPQDLLAEALRVTRPGGCALFSSYAESFWPHRLDWFRAQADHGLLGEIDETATGSGVIVCRDGFRATTVGPDEFKRLTGGLGLRAAVTVVDDSSVFCEIIVT